MKSLEMKPGMKVYSINFEEECGAQDIYDYEFESFKVISSHWALDNFSQKVEEVVKVKGAYGSTTEFGRRFLLSGREKKVFESLIQKRKTDKNKQLWKFMAQERYPGSYPELKVDYVIARNGIDAENAFLKVQNVYHNWGSIEPYDGPKKNKSVVMK